jgi:hypothetical protein
MVTSADIRQIRRGEQGCSLCGLNYIMRNVLQGGGWFDLKSRWCTDKPACSERWLRKYLSGRSLELESVKFIGNGPNLQAVFEIAYRVAGEEKPRLRTVMPEVRPGGDMHRASEHYHVIEFGRDITDSFRA